MIFDLGEPDRSSLPEYDVCIIGSGPAGITVANELKDTRLRIALLESGKLRNTANGDRLREVRSEGILVRDDSRERILGGASTSWSGLSSPLDDIDMQPRPWLRQSGWPMQRSELLACYEQASQRYGFPPLERFTANALRGIRENAEVRLAWEKLDEKIFMSASVPQNFGRLFRDIFEAENVDLYLDATLLRLESEGQEHSISRALLRNCEGTGFEIRARVFVLAAGGIENARILLNSASLCEAGLGNEHDQVGRYMMNHPKNHYGLIRLHRPVKELPYYFGCLFEGYAGYAGLRLKEQVQREKGLLNSYVRFEPLFPWHRNEGVKALVYLMKRCKPFMSAWMKSRQDKVVSLKDYAETGDDSDAPIAHKSLRAWLSLFRRILVNLPTVSQYAWARLHDGSELKVRTIRLRNFLEMEPDPDNRVMLGDQKDIYGQPVPVVRHSCSALDKESLIALHAALREELARNNLGRLESSLETEKEWPVQLDASHHIGTTRMGVDPKTSVVNPDCRLHTVPNVYLAGSSVFPTSGCANPTYTIVALSIRLAGHLAQLLNTTRTSVEQTGIAR